jgi:HEPN domain-containing protein
MSDEKNFREASRWLTTADGDLEAAVILKETGKFAHSCFHAQQAGEKAIKALWFFADANPWGHSIQKMIEDLEHVDVTLYRSFESFIRMGRILDRFYIPTRYPNGLPDITPDAAFSEEDAVTCIEYSKKIVDAVHVHLKL